MSIIESIASFVSAASPALGALIPIPGGAAILKGLSSAFGAKNNDDLLSAMQNDPNYLEKITAYQQVVYSHLEKMDQDDVERYKTNVADRDSARVNDAKNQTKFNLYVNAAIKAYLVLFITAALIICVWLLSKNPTNETIKQVTYQLIPILAVIYYFHWSSSEGSQKKSELLSQLHGK